MGFQSSIVDTVARVEGLRRAYWAPSPNDGSRVLLKLGFQSSIVDTVARVEVLRRAYCRTNVVAHTLRCNISAARGRAQFARTRMMPSVHSLVPQPSGSTGSGGHGNLCAAQGMMTRRCDT